MRTNQKKHKSKLRKKKSKLERLKGKLTKRLSSSKSPTKRMHWKVASVLLAGI